MSASRQTALVEPVTYFCSSGQVAHTSCFACVGTETGNYYFGARYYSSNEGRFMSPDWDTKPTAVPYAEFSDPQTLNLYAYVENSPVDKVDADGHVAERSRPAVFAPMMVAGLFSRAKIDQQAVSVVRAMVAIAVR